MIDLKNTSPDVSQQAEAVMSDAIEAARAAANPSPEDAKQGESPAKIPGNVIQGCIAYVLMVKRDHFRPGDTKDLFFDIFAHGVYNALTARSIIGIINDYGMQVSNPSAHAPLVRRAKEWLADNSAVWLDVKLR